MRKYFCTLLLVTMLLVSCVACAGNEGGESKNEPVNYYEYTDDCGRKVMLPEQINSFVASGPLSQIVLMSVAPEELKGLAVRWDASASGIIADEYLNLPYIGQLYDSSDLNIEGLAATAPDIIIDIGEAKPSIVQDMDELQKQTGIPAVHIEASLETMPQAYEKLGVLLDKTDKCAELSQYLQNTYDRTVSIMVEVGENKQRAIYVQGDNGESVVMKGSYHSKLIDMLTDNQAVSDTAVANGLGNEVSIEQIALWNPDIILFASEKMYENVENMPAWKELTAIKNGNYVLVPSCPYNWLGTPPSVQMYLGMIWLTQMMYPQYSEYDLKEEVCEYYRLFYGCQLTDEQYEDVIKGAGVK